ncbi:hypothetical protein ONS95_002204 [Cadophora gregata]|uniref:uncharacterized protein n=1 Tax=Cadophora gregata TaxID=51156 RepID=UPI0026DA743E|nr:uncharacterized protein ONS95_002204 [Cadophora gregata]KAK0109515.1 hypothetical protein ONS95_002204 [Cadophora gregata]
MRLRQIERQSLKGLINSSRHFQCIDPRDRLYGILALLDIRNQQMDKLDRQPSVTFPVVDYSETNGELYADLVRWCLSSGEISPSDALIFSQNVQRALEFPFPGAPTTIFAEIHGVDQQESCKVLFTEEDCTEVVASVASLERVECSYVDRSFIWTDVLPGGTPTARSLDKNLTAVEDFYAALQTQQGDAIGMNVIDNDIPARTYRRVLGTFRQLQTCTGWWYVGPPDAKEGDIVDQKSMLLLRRYNAVNEVSIIGKVVKYDPRVHRMKNTDGQGESDWTKFTPVGNSSLEKFRPLPGDLKAFLTLSEIQLLTR